MRLVDSEEIIDCLKFLLKPAGYNKHFVNGVKTAMDIINDTPTEHVEIRANWETLENTYRCSRCGYEETFASRYNFCPYCGAGMNNKKRTGGDTGEQ